ncbi:hypothetical protein CEXT_717311 [Caerostris extrusa]|uniref:Uncharacterized protein n=1 Tax=Caerostris extrusa TaxID=172846 RepID=A0AAV4Y194_CAEEX|nr:hypothetical protein CEXT_717311 [Caerostris extrusa]
MWIRILLLSIGSHVNTFRPTDLPTGKLLSPDQPAGVAEASGAEECAVRVPQDGPARIPRRLERHQGEGASTASWWTPSRTTCPTC